MRQISATDPMQYLQDLRRTVARLLLSHPQQAVKTPKPDLTEKRHVLNGQEVQVVKVHAVVGWAKQTLEAGLGGTAAGQL